MKKRNNNHDDGQGDLFADYGEAYARANDPDTSHEAAEEIKGSKASRLESLVLACLKEHPAGLTMHEICERTGLRWNTASPRIRPLCRKNFVFDSGVRRQGPIGKTCVVWQPGTRPDPYVEYCKDEPAP